MKKKDLRAASWESKSLNAEKAWWLVTVKVARPTEEIASVLLMELGSRGIVTAGETAESVSLGAYFDGDFAPEQLTASIEREFKKAGYREGLLDISTSVLPDQDWLHKWKEGFEPILVCERFVVAPSWKLPDSTGGRLVICIDPGMAFGTGTHETTILCLELIEKYWRGGSLLDVGTGTGILAIAAALLEPGSRVIAVDVDPQAVDVARENIAANKVSSVEIFEGQPHQFAAEAFDVVVANLTAEVIVNLVDDLIACLGQSGMLILSGILNDYRADVERSIKKAGPEIVERREAGEWSAIVARRTR